MTQGRSTYALFALQAGEKMKLIKRNGSEAVFDREKISIAVTKANMAVDERHRITDEEIQAYLQLHQRVQ